MNTSIESGVRHESKPFGERDAQHVANLLNFFKNKWKLDGRPPFTSSGNLGQGESLYFSKINTDNKEWYRKSVGLNLLDNVKKHFFGKSPEQVAKFLNQLFSFSS